MPAKCDRCGGEVRPRNGKVTQPCRKCRQAPRKSAAAAKEKPAPVKALKESNLQSRPARPPRLGQVAGDLATMCVDDLVAERERAMQRAGEVLEELRRRKDAIDDALGEGGVRPTGTGG
jgi:hypothetical protein